MPRKKCIHNRRPQMCKDCGGSYICIHNKQKNKCYDCAKKCKHDKLSFQCTECSFSVCKHDIFKWKCKICKPENFCEHKKRKELCKDCGGSSQCEHGKQKHQCKDCGGSSQCEHGKIKQQCKDCKGSKICIHEKQKHLCKECDGSAYCIHKKVKQQCLDCLTIEKILGSKTKRFCQLCCSKWLDQNRFRKGILQCADCDKTVPERIEKIFVRKLMTLLSDQPPSAIDNVLLGGSVCGTDKKHRVDLAWVLPDRVIILEVDENGGHPDQDATCEIARMSRIVESIHTENVKPVIFLRVNPDEYDQARISLDNRVKAVAQGFLEALIASFEATKIQVYQFFYHSKCKDKIETAQSNAAFDVTIRRDDTLKRMREENYEDDS